MHKELIATVSFRDYGYCQIPMEMFRELIKENDKSPSVSAIMLRDFMEKHLNDDEDYKGMLIKSLKELNEFIVREVENKW